LGRQRFEEQGNGSYPQTGPYAHTFVEKQDGSGSYLSHHRFNYVLCSASKTVSTADRPANAMHASFLESRGKKEVLDANRRSKEHRPDAMGSENGDRVIQLTLQSRP
jgi:hypothetical protein